MTIDEMNKEDFDIIRHLDTIKSRKLCTVEMPLCMPLNNKHQWKSYSKVHAMQQFLFSKKAMQQFHSSKKKKKYIFVALHGLYCTISIDVYLFFPKKSNCSNISRKLCTVEMPLWTPLNNKHQWK